jgi:hypothetical protein
MTQADRIEALEATVAKLVEAIVLADPVAAAQLFAASTVEAEDAEG